MGRSEPIDRKAVTSQALSVCLLQTTLPTMVCLSEISTFKHIPSSANVVCYCGSGVTATQNLFALLLAGRSEPALYPVLGGMDRRRTTAHRYRVILVSIQSPNVIVSPGSIRSLDYDDIYFSDDAEREVNRVFLEPAKIKERMKYATVFSVGELGFGSGLNFLTPPISSLKSAPETADCVLLASKNIPFQKRMF
ncbi:MAG: hypothetical protein CM1200mP24_03630 [Gammaproteobacteria bacterium]|nr:MAG: hypothetical protein CM1200mP24_03630 [Gammaproteobacteria bacterium]